MFLILSKNLFLCRPILASNWVMGFSSTCIGLHPTCPMHSVAECTIWKDVSWQYCVPLLEESGYPSSQGSSPWLWDHAQQQHQWPPDGNLPGQSQIVTDCLQGETYKPVNGPQAELLTVWATLGLRMEWPRMVSLCFESHWVSQLLVTLNKYSLPFVNK